MRGMRSVFGKRDAKGVKRHHPLFNGLLVTKLNRRRDWRNGTKVAGCYSLLCFIWYINDINNYR